MKTFTTSLLAFAASLSLVAALPSAGLQKSRRTACPIGVDVTLIAPDGEYTVWVDFSEPTYPGPSIPNLPTDLMLTAIQAMMQTSTQDSPRYLSPVLFMTTLSLPATSLASIRTRLSLMKLSRLMAVNLAPLRLSLRSLALASVTRGRN
jgi:hypothetical protein